MKRHGRAHDSLERSDGNYADMRASITPPCLFSLKSHIPSIPLREPIISLLLVGYPGMRQCLKIHTISYVVFSLTKVNELNTLAVGVCQLGHVSNQAIGAQFKADQTSSGKGTCRVYSLQQRE